MSRKFITLVTASAIALSSLTATQAAASDKKLRQFIAGAAALVIIGSAINDSKARDRGHVTRQYHPNPHDRIRLQRERQHRQEMARLERQRELARIEARRERERREARLERQREYRRAEAHRAHRQERARSYIVIPRPLPERVRRHAFGHTNR
ncbi:hypothetical protein [Rhodalgimonas zhirmunskyi]|uniref:Uncharacterized protein n=1 Tax=Rhodalgimonas zhirmunskyi TaxID=2964767 RepID=A0AAJ1X5D1_9RHOB|nr:hypothetical protein [Rhodoalgimonas zhirmunskyi]MDQ2094416.1 hypothetical protein [Rhodoalgimonas zhirmunskyi]